MDAFLGPNAELDRLRQALRARDDFIAVVAHELRNPVSALHLQTEALMLLLKKHPGDVPPPIVARIESLKRQTEAFVKRATALLDVSRASSGSILLEPEPLDLVALLRTIVEAFRAELEMKKLALRTSAPRSIDAFTDRLRFEQIVFNLISNAVKYGDGKPIFVGLRATQGYVSLVVRDRGIGIAESDQERIFERFGRGSNHSHEAGFGVGLWLVRQLVQAMQGTISLRSRVGRGSCFTVRLPRRSQNGVK